MRTRNALLRALLTLCLVVTCSFALGTRANADDPLPRAIPAARGFQRAFTSYDAVVAYATGIAQDQSVLDSRLAATQTAFDATLATLGASTPAPGHGGALFDTESDALARDLVLQREVLSEQAVSLWRTRGQLVAEGALTAAVSAWQLPTGGQITQPFGPTVLGVEPPLTYNGVAYAHFHDGVDIAGAWAAPVVAPARGRVVFVGTMSDGAEIVVLAHDNGVVTLYAHLDATGSPPPVKAGDEVAAGQRIGTVGLTGMTTGEHLHWSAWRDGKLIDPMSLLKK